MILTMMITRGLVSHTHSALTICSTVQHVVLGWIMPCETTVPSSSDRHTGVPVGPLHHKERHRHLSCRGTPEGRPTLSQYCAVQFSTHAYGTCPYEHTSRCAGPHTVVSSNVSAEMLTVVMRLPHMESSSA